MCMNKSSTNVDSKDTPFSQPIHFSLETILQGENRHSIPGQDCTHTVLTFSPTSNSLSQKLETLSSERVTGNLVKIEKFKNI